MKVGIFYASATGTCRAVAEKIASKLGVAAGDVHDVSKASAADADQYDVLLLGSSTWVPGEMQSDWYDFASDLKPHLKGKKVGLFGTGDGSTYSDTFVDAIGAMFDEFSDSGCTFIGSMPTDGYDFGESLAVRDGEFVGLPIDEDNESGKTDERIAQWVTSLKL